MKEESRHSILFKLDAFVNRDSDIEFLQPFLTLDEKPNNARLDSWL